MGDRMEYRHLARRGTEIREVSETADAFRYLGYSSVFNHEYRVFDWWEGEFIEVVEPGAFTKTLRDNSGKFPVLRAHEEHIGYTTDGGEDSRGLWFEHEIMLDVPEGRATAALIRQAHRIGKPMGESMGFAPIIEQWQEPTRDNKLRKRYLREVRLFETSPTPFPANDAAGATDVRAGLRHALDCGTINLDSPIRALLANPAAARGNLEPEDIHSVAKVIDRLHEIVRGGN